MAHEDFRYKSEFRVRFGETDLQGVVFNANYLLYADTAQMDYLRHLGIHYAGMRERGFDIVIVEARVRFQAPARFDDLIEAFARVSEIGNTSIKMAFEMYVGETPVAAVETAYVITDAETGEPTRVPAYIRAAVQKFEGKADAESE